MLFSSIVFLFYFFPIVLLLYFATKFSRTLQNLVLLFSSLVFYAWGEPRFVVVMVGSILVNYVFGILIDRTRSNHKLMKTFLVLAIVVNVGNLFIFKYLTFVFENINSNFSIYLPVPEILLPIGISFFTFQAMSYVIDVFRGTASVQKNIFNLGLYIALFPQLIAGPIVRYTTISKQIMERRETSTKFAVGCCRFLTGLAKKILLANNMAIVADHIFTMSANEPIPVMLAWVGAIAYTLQIYFDFSAYSDMAIGLGLMFGFEFEENFNYPYMSKSITEFWRRWHISLGSWFRDYVYIPLGGSRVRNTDLLIRNLLIVWVLTGVWHGAEWTFVAWGLLNFAFIAFEKLVNFNEIKRFNVLKHVYAMFFIVLGWVIFRAANLPEAGQYISSMFGASGHFWSDIAVMFIREYWIFFSFAIILSQPISRRVNRIVVDHQFPLVTKVVTYSYPLVITCLFLICVMYLVKGSYNPFIYFNF
ncbi:alginate O-acetyltransferase complex protein AlgI [Bacillus mesophilus]|uniref:MBOAT family protein n=1 Tax=Bacillus mesophilus TaxID=1808955 RepID=A0A6M0Q7P1_9BACI|nr:MBOAT family protein [Bacillus mesophilus]MBM7661700.1 alginate O-acetyltransferase complex protein AlgI [Bacillus mesophilus]NEY72362.1 MBOAT family protein [Bacillus mesophilus]